MARDPVCFACGAPTGPLPRLNRLPNGTVCPTCRDRLLETLPPVLPAPRDEEAPIEEEEWAERSDGADDLPEGA